MIKPVPPSSQGRQDAHPRRFNWIFLICQSLSYQVTTLYKSLLGLKLRLLLILRSLPEAYLIAYYSNRSLD
ncbi:MULTISPECIES: hypothetical protein [Nostoc]|uniref:Uncharacterized protein n=1 Tax=Nostoc paludosum FACHB-159 TaxID=2692908 RepID=A0ABR8KGI6_9NOSO|nr:MULTISPECIES: hypothetical protein [Nostoc]MBD2681509.1 hypothetical protein [Nostoc sp. FACHB-857]MBD2737969.1 hypothetical protein [Nostoc paludosum FACHB-159]